jgi:mRNA-degrading endonuclease toxin of MazEF toxin-antitoxin module
VRSIDKRRVLRVFAQIRDDELERVDAALRVFLGLDPQPAEL